MTSATIRLLALDYQGGVVTAFFGVVYNHWTGPVDWTSGLDWWTDIFCAKNHFCALMGSHSPEG